MDRIVRLNAGFHGMEAHLLNFAQMMIGKAATSGGHLIKIVLKGSGLIIKIVISCSGRMVDVVVTRSSRVVYTARLSFGQLAAMAVASGVQLFETLCCRVAQLQQEASIRGDELVDRITGLGGRLSAEGGVLLERAVARGTLMYRNASTNGVRMIAQATSRGGRLCTSGGAMAIRLGTTGGAMAVRLGTSGGAMAARVGTSTYRLVHVLSTGGFRLVSRATIGGGYLVQRATYGGWQCMSQLGGGGVRLLRPLFEGCGWLQELIEEYKQQVAEAETQPKAQPEPQAQAKPKDIHGWKVYGPKELRLLSVVCGIPKKRGECPKMGRNGDDAWFAASTSRGDTLGVADGVECRWISSLSPGEFSNSLMRSCERLALRPSHDPRRLDVLMHRANCDLQEVRHPVLASCHSCLLSLNRRTGIVYATNIGGCGFLVVRKGKIIARSTKQLQVAPTALITPPFQGIGSFLYGDLNQPSIQQFRAEAGDMLILATDGFFDNVDDGSVLSLIIELEGGTDPRRMHLYAETLVLMARAAACSNVRTGSTRQPKTDDITVVLAVVN